MTAEQGNPTLPQAHEEICRRLSAADVPYVIHEHAPLRTVEDAVAAAEFDARRFLKTLLFRGGDGWWLVALRGQDRLDYRRLADAIGVPRGAIVAATHDDVVAVSGCEPGAVSPVPAREGLQLLLDSAATTVDRVYTGSGRPDCTLEIAMTDLLAVAMPRIASLRREGDAG